MSTTDIVAALRANATAFHDARTISYEEMDQRQRALWDEAERMGAVRDVTRILVEQG